MACHEGPKIKIYFFSNLGTRGGGLVINVTPRLLYPRKESRYPYYRKLDGTRGPV